MILNALGKATASNGPAQDACLGCLHRALDGGTESSKVQRLEAETMVPSLSLAEVLCAHKKNLS